MPVVLRAAVRVPARDAARLRQRARVGRDDLLPRRGEVVEDPVAVGEVRDGAVAGQRAHADDVRERGGVARERPRPARRLVGVADGRDDDHAPGDRVLDRGGLERRERVPLRVERVADPAEAEVDHARAAVDGPAHGLDLGLERDGPVGAHDLAHEQLRAEGDPGRPLGVVQRRDHARDERPVALLIGGRAAADEAPRGGDPVAELRMLAVDPGVDHGDERARERRLLGPGRERADVLEVPLARVQRVGRREREPPRGVEPLDPRDAGAAGRGLVGRDGERAEREMLARDAPVEPRSDGVGVRPGDEPDGVARRLRRRREDERDPDGCEELHAGRTSSSRERPTAYPRPGA